MRQPKTIKQIPQRAKPYKHNYSNKQQSTNKKTKTNKNQQKQKKNKSKKKNNEQTRANTIKQIPHNDLTTFNAAPPPPRSSASIAAPGGVTGSRLGGPIFWNLKRSKNCGDLGSSSNKPPRNPRLCSYLKAKTVNWDSFVVSPLKHVT